MVKKFRLTNLSTGSHNVTIYAMDQAGNIGASATINFTVAASATLNLNENAPAIIVTAVVIVIVVVGLVYFKKIRH